MMTDKFSAPAASRSPAFREFGVPIGPRPVVMILSGPSGVGKDSAIDALQALGQVDFHRVVTATSRAPRPGEVDGKDYHFVSLTRFAEMINRDELLEYAIVYNDYKGVPKREITEPLQRGQDVIMRVDVQGAATMARILPGACTVFLTTATEQELLQRLRDRQTDSEEQIAIRMAHARKELAELAKFTYVVVNHRDHLDHTARILWAILEAERARTNYQRVAL